MGQTALKGLVTYSSPQSNNALRASREELKKNGISYDLYRVRAGKKNILKHNRSIIFLLFALLFNSYDFIILNSGPTFLQRQYLTKFILLIASIKKTLVYVRWGSGAAILQKVKNAIGQRKYESGRRLMNSSKIYRHLTLSPYSAKELTEELNVKCLLLIYNCNKLPAKYLQPMPPEDDPIVINVASLNHWKGPDLFVEIAKLVCKKHPTVSFFWVGSNGNKKLNNMIIEAGLQERVQFIGKVLPPYDWMQKASILLFTSRSDAFGLVCAEAMACYRNVICFKGSGPEFVVGDAGKAVPSEDVGAAADEVMRIISKPASERVNFRAYERYDSMFSPEKYAERLADILKHPEEAEKKYKYIAT